MLWIWLSLTAGLLQALRNGVARGLAGQIGPDVNTWARFTFNVPYSALAVVLLERRSGAATLSRPFFAWCAITAVAQLLGNSALVAAFARGNFAQAITLHKLEIVFSAVIGLLLGTELPTPLGWLGIAVCFAGTLAINFGRDAGPAGWRRAFHADGAVALALAAGLLFSCTGFALKTAAEHFARDNPQVGSGRFEAAVQTLFHTTWMEVALLSLWLLLRRAPLASALKLHWRRMFVLGAASFAASVCWYWANSIAYVAYVKAVGQIESVVAIALALALWGEKEVWRQLPGMALLGIGIALIVLGG